MGKSHNSASTRKSVGGCRRTIILPCGKHIQDKPERIQLKINLHQKSCACCKKYPKFNSSDYAFSLKQNLSNFKQNNESNSSLGKRTMVGHSLACDGGWSGERTRVKYNSWSEAKETMNTLINLHQEEVKADIEEVKESEQTKKQRRKSQQKAKKKHKEKFAECLSKISERDDMTWFAWDWGEHLDPKYYFDDSDDEDVDVGSVDEQIANRVGNGDCVISAWYGLWDNRDKDDLELLTIITPMYWEKLGRVGCATTAETHVIHQVLYNPKKDRIYDYSNNRKCIKPYDVYVMGCSPTPDAVIKTELTWSKIVEASKTFCESEGYGWLEWDDSKTASIAYMYMEREHTLLMSKINTAHYTPEYMVKLNKDIKNNWELLIESFIQGRADMVIPSMLQSWIDDGKSVW